MTEKPIKPGTLITVVALAGIFGILANTNEGPGLTNTSMAVQIPIVLQLALNALLLAALTAGFMYILQSIGLDLTGYAESLSVTLGSFLIALAQHWIDLVPAQYDPAIQMILNVLVVVIGGLGTLRTLFRRN